VLPGVVGLIQATEIIKLILEGGAPLIGRLLLYDAMKMNFKEVRVRKDPECVLCGEHPSVTELIDYKAFCDVPLPGDELPDGIDEAAYELSPLEFKKAMDQDPNAILVDVRETFEWDICRIDGARLMPLSSFDPSTTGLDPEATIYLYCYKGKRSMLALKELKRTGFNNLKNLSGGIDLWAEEVDSDMPQY
jgi:adenylyltransferase/sulfurtransferase